MEDIKEKESRLPRCNHKSAPHRLFMALIVLLLIALIGSGSFICGMFFNNYQNTQEDTIPTINSVQIVTDIQNIGELATIKYIYTDMGKFENSEQFKGYDIPLTTKSFILSWKGTIKAGVDTKEITINVDENLKNITINLPKAKILSHETDQSSVEIFDEKNNIFNPITVEDYTEFFQDSKLDMEHRAIENGILEEALESSKTMINQTLKLVPNVEMYTIIFKNDENIDI